MGFPFEGGKWWGTIGKVEWPDYSNQQAIMNPRIQALEQRLSHLYEAMYKAKRDGMITTANRILKEIEDTQKLVRNEENFLPPSVRDKAKLKQKKINKVLLLCH